MTRGERMSTAIKKVISANFMTRSMKMFWACTGAAAKGSWTIIATKRHIMATKTVRDGRRFTGWAVSIGMQINSNKRPSVNSMRRISNMARLAPHCM